MSKSTKMFVLTGRVRQDMLYEVSTYLDDHGVEDILIIPHRQRGSRVVEAVEHKDEKPKAKRGGGLRVVRGGYKGKLRAFVDDKIRNGASEIATLDVRHHSIENGFGKQTSSNLLSGMVNAGELIRTEVGLYKPSAAYRRKVMNGAIAHAAPLGMANDGEVVVEPTGVPKVRAGIFRDEGGITATVGAAVLATHAAGETITVNHIATRLPGEDRKRIRDTLTFLVRRNLLQRSERGTFVPAGALAASA